MRHVFGFLLGILVTAALLFGTGWATQGAVQGAANLIAPVNQTQVLVALGAIAATGLVLGLVLVARLSPLTVFVPSIVLLAWTVVYVLDVTRAMNLAPVAGNLQQDLVRAGRGMQTLLASGIYLMLGIALFIPVLMPSRWAGPEHDDDDFDDNREQSGYY
ncbi:hypothetical protein AB0K60_16090 [Thermopolyspora sp. NPDC052614]|uniref:hypothetical protein n=1 Tax=Thermopolyspora sp. NPDC052614 TaxID=3155682 RepID=UPI003430AE23